MLLFDDATFDEEEIVALLNVVPACAVVLAGARRMLWGEGVTVPLRGLPDREAMRLIERELGRTLSNHERGPAQVLADDLQGDPTLLVRAAAEVGANRTTFATASLVVMPRVMSREGAGGTTSTSELPIETSDRRSPTSTAPTSSSGKDRHQPRPVRRHTLQRRVL